MPDSVTPNQLDPEMEMLRLNKLSGYHYRERRQDDWNESYELYRDKVITNRLTQRQSVNLPIMKQTVRTLLKDVDDMPVLYFENLDNDKEAETFQNEYWKYTVECNNMELQDIVDKRQVFLFGRSFDQWQIIDGKVKMTIVATDDILVSRYFDHTDLHSSRFLIHNHIFKPLASLRLKKDYDQDKVAELQDWMLSNEGLTKISDNAEMLSKKNEKMQAMGDDEADDPILGESYVELSLHFVWRENEKNAAGELLEPQIFMYVEAENRFILMKKPLEEVIGVTSDHFWQTHFPYNTWADDVEKQDFWSDGIADIVRTPNKVANSWYSQLVENRTLRNFGMHYYDSSANPDFQPGTFNPVPWGWYGIPGKPSDFMQKVDVPDLSESLDEMKFLMDIVDRASGATATQQGAQPDRQVTLGAIKLALGEAKERVKGMSKFYTPAWKARGQMFLKMIEAGADKLDAVKIYKKGKNTNDIYERMIEPKDWMTKSGYQTKIWSQDEKNTEDTNTLQKLNAAKQMMPQNMKLDEIFKRKTLEFCALSPEEINAIMELDARQQEAMIQAQNMAAGGFQPVGQTQPIMPMEQQQPGQQVQL